MKRPLYAHIASRVVAMENCRKSNNAEWLRKHAASIEKLVADFMPSGSGIDSGTSIALDECRADKLVFTTDYHHMTEGYYDGWSSHDVIVKPSLTFGIEVRITGRDRNDVKEYLYQVYDQALRQEVEDEYLGLRQAVASAATTNQE